MNRYLNVEVLGLDDAFWLGMTLHIAKGDFDSPATKTKRSSTPYPRLWPWMPAPVRLPLPKLSSSILDDPGFQILISFKLHELFSDRFPEIFRNLVAEKIKLFVLHDLDYSNNKQITSDDIPFQRYHLPMVWAGLPRLSLLLPGPSTFLFW